MNHEMILSLEELMETPLENLLERLSEETGMDISSADFSISHVVSDPETGENKVALLCEYEKDIEDLDSNLQQFIQQAKEFEEMGRDYPSFGAGNIAQRSEELLRHAQSQQGQISQAAFEKIKHLASTTQYYSNNNTDMNANLLLSELQKIQETLGSKAQALTRQLLQEIENEHALASEHQFNTRYSSSRLIKRIESILQEEPLPSTATYLLEELHNHLKTGNDPESYPSYPQIHYLLKKTLKAFH